MPKQETHVSMVKDGEQWDCPVAYVEAAKEKGWRKASSSTTSSTKKSGD